MKRTATAVDCGPALTYHSFPMSPPFPRSCACLSLVVLLSIGLHGCATSDDATKPVTYSLTAKQNYEKGMAELKDEDYAEAAK